MLLYVVTLISFIFIKGESTGILYELRDKNAIGGRIWDIANQERKVCDTEYEIVTYVVKESAKLTVPSSRSKIEKVLRGIFTSKSQEKTRREFGKTSLNNWSISRTEPGVREGKHSLLACHTHCKCSWKLLVIR